MVILCGIISIFSLIYSFCAFLQKGPLLLSAYLFANSKERQKMKTKKEYRFVSTLYFGVSIIFFLLALALSLNISWIMFLAVILAFILVGFVLIAFEKK